MCNGGRRSRYTETVIPPMPTPPPRPLRVTVGSLLAVGSLLSAAWVGAGDIFGLDKKKQRRKPPANVLSGEITSLSETSFQIKPWDPTQPRRVLVTATPATVYVRQERGSAKDVKAGDLLALVEEPRDYPRISPAPNETSEQRRERETREKALKAEVDAQPARLRAVLRLWPGALEGDTTEPASAGGRGERRDEADADKRGAGRVSEVVEALLHGAAGHFRGERRGGVNPPGPRNAVAVGTVKALNPLTVSQGEKEPVFRPQGETVWLRHTPIRPEDLRKGKTVLIRAVAAPGADGAVQAVLIAVVPEPIRTPQQERKIILRERGND
jgi:hypothetical protein